MDQTTGMKLRSIDVSLKTLQIYGKSKTAIWAESYKRSFSAIIHRGYSMLNKHLLRKTQNFFCPLCIFKGRSLFLRLLKLAFSPDESHSRPSTILSILSVFDRRFTISLKPLSLWSPKSTAISTVRFWWVIFSQHDANSTISWLSSTPTAFASYKALINTSSNENILFLSFTTKSLIYVFAVSIAYFRLHIVQVSRFMAGSCCPSCFATESALYCVSDKCLVRRNGTSSFQNTVEWKQVSIFFRAECGSVCRTVKSTWKVRNVNEYWQLVYLLCT